MQLNVLTADEHIHIVEAQSDWNLLRLHAAVQAATRIPAAEQVLLWQGNPLEDPGKSLGDYGITDGEILQVIGSTSAGLSAVSMASSASSNNPEEALRQLVSRDPRLAQALQARPELHGPLVERIRQQQQMQHLTEADMFNPEAQARIEQMIKQQAIEENFHAALEHTPEAFGSVTMLYVDCEINKTPAKAFVDSGAQVSILSAKFTRECHLNHLIDTRFSGVARGVGTGKILGRVHQAHLVLGGQHLVCSFNVLESIDMDILIGLDMLRRHQASIDLARNALVVNGVATPFLPEHEVPKFSAEEIAAERQATVPGVTGSPAGTSTPGSAPITSIPSAPTAATPTSARVPATPQPTSVASRQTFPEASIGFLMELGASRSEAIRALERTGGNLDMAAGLLFE
ncbi:DNA damage-inducible protein 1 [Tieghemiomyces parasiticus]|uniref:DNA damage-inducible protein 1 n=1 Tax=Tieghemiomyces parasiticus TaxID=78921 RepID=A0A9W8DT40_9FUNG|nr:DNA damage-inducible protein 1 [Tieghemiomyces parasiticus]